MYFPSDTFALFYRKYFREESRIMVKKVAAINDLSGLGRCSLAAAIPVLSVMGVQACPIPTAILTNQTEYDSFYCYDYTDKLEYYISEWKKRNITLDGIYTGFLGSESQVDKILRFCETFKKENTLLLVDPVMGDGGIIYDTYTPEMIQKMKLLALSADVITPNLTECCLLTDSDYREIISYENDSDYLKRIEEMARPLLQSRIQTIIITGIIYQSETDNEPKYYNLVITDKECHYTSTTIYGGHYSGTGDLLASVVCGGIVRGETAYESLKLAVKFLDAALEESVRKKVEQNDGVNFESHLPLLFNNK